jgi:CHAT domain-containing protein
MEKVLIITYYYPPCNLTASRRVESFAKYLPDQAYYPIVVTRKWETEVKKPADILTQTSKDIKIIKNKNSEVHYLPYNPCLRDKIFQKSKNPIFKILSKILTITQILGHSFSVKSVPFSNLYFHSKNLIKEHNINKLIISANPFEIFLFGYLLKRKYDIDWIADYRDDWNTSELPEYTDRSGFVKKIESHYEKKWLATSSVISSISPHYANKISKYVKRPAEVILKWF